MTQDHDATEPRTAARDEVAIWLYMNTAIRYSWDLPFAEAPERTQEHYRLQADSLVAYLAGHGYTIAPTEPGRVVIDRSALERFEAWAAQIPEDEWATEDRYAFAALQDAIAAERAATGGA